MRSNSSPLQKRATWKRVTTLVAASALLVGGTTLAGSVFGQGLGAATAVQAGDERLNTDVGHAAPFVYDFDGDGKRDLLVGQMGAGHLRIYKNIGTNDAPKFGKDFEVFRAEGEDATVPTG